MTDHAESIPFASSESPLPGLEPPPSSASPLRTAAHRTIVALEAAGYLDESHAVVTQLVLDLADDLAAARRGAKAYAIAQLSAQLLAAYAVLSPTTEGGGSDAFADLVADIRRGASAARDPLDARPSE